MSGGEPSGAESRPFDPVLSGLAVLIVVALAAVLFAFFFQHGHFVSIGGIFAVTLFLVTLYVLYEAVKPRD